MEGNLSELEGILKFWMSVARYIRDNSDKPEFPLLRKVVFVPRVREDSVRVRTHDEILIYLNATQKEFALHLINAVAYEMRENCFKMTGRRFEYEGYTKAFGVTWRRYLDELSARCQEEMLK
jgi:hypothetical protein